MYNSKNAKYKIIDTNIDKRIIGKQVTVEKIKVKNSSGGNGGRKPGVKNKMTLDKLAKIVIGMSSDVNGIKTDVSNLRSDVNTLKTNLNRIVKLNNLKH